MVQISFHHITFSFPSQIIPHKARAKKSVDLSWASEILREFSNKSIDFENKKHRRLLYYKNHHFL